MVKSQTTSITPAQHAARHVVGGADPLVAPLLPHHTEHEIGGADEIARSRYLGGVTGDRVWDGIYQNRSPDPIYIGMYLMGGNGDTWNLLVENATPPTVVADTYTCAGGINYTTLRATVPSMSYYRLTTSDGTNTIQSWSETSQVVWV
jgi:hypothetical protein